MSLRGRFALILAVSAWAPGARAATPAHPLKNVTYKNAIRNPGIQQRGTK
jgi:hypothetical protein